MSKKSQKQLTDIFLAFLLILLMSSQSTEQRAHEYIGVFALFVVLVHQILNSWWYKLKILKNSSNLAQNFINFALIISFVISIISGLAMSKYAAAIFSGFMKISFARVLHLCATHWFFVFAGLHIGFHALNLAKKLKPSTFANALIIGSWLISLYGFWLFLDTGMVDYMLAKVQFAFLDFKIPLYQSMLNGATMLFSWAFIGFLLAKFIKNLKETK
ncbi:DUF4405 domain-containing protein [Campylobacter sp. JMF_06 NA1]|uniref:DUF4405 domain-containing protein n=1 Tax=Campylobacter sp. JMF_06 NA1 TaxID=2983823 RepID=UPI0022E9A851|nr:DUF4405 domain-containing protein [Campylobacter sp. JMF_06 NA1]MDA3078594.1 DUF4405 domain-containing protein [Campylobacter sp. JMF_06 NA1]